jgi:hypothetical protein
MRTRGSHCGRKNFSRSLLRSKTFLLQSYAIRRNATKISSAIVTSEKHAVQHCKKLRKSFSLNLEINCSIKLSYGRRIDAMRIADAHRGDGSVSSYVQLTRTGTG